MKQTIEIGGRECLLYQEGEKPQVLLIQALGIQERASIDKEVELIRERVTVPFVMAAFAIGDWEVELTPWHDPKVSRRLEVGEHAFDTLDYITETFIPRLYMDYGELPIILGGYSLGGLFARWAVSKVQCFDGAVCCSPSLWITSWQGFSDAHEIFARYVYLSLGDREEFSKNKAIAQVGNNVRWEYKHLEQVLGPGHSTLEWNPGNHFVDGDKRMAKGFAWCIQLLLPRRDREQE